MQTSEGETFGMPAFSKDDVSYRRHERAWGNYEKFVRLHNDIDSNKVVCHYSNGVLGIQMGRIGAAGGTVKRRLNIKGGL
jgi:HSP20 family molecular chaperone IbpA